MKKVSLAWLAVLVLAMAAGAAQEALFSGPQVGEKATPFRILGITGPEAGKEAECSPGPEPVVLVFVHQLERSIVPLLHVVDQYAAEKKGALKAQIVFLMDDRV